MLIGRTGDKDRPPIRRLIETTLVVRASCGQAPFHASPRAPGKDPS